MVDVAEKNYLMGEIQKCDRQIEKLSWCVVWMILLRPRNKNNGILLIYQQILQLFCLYHLVFILQKKLNVEN